MPARTRGYLPRTRRKRFRRWSAVMDAPTKGWISCVVDHHRPAQQQFASRPTQPRALAAQAAWIDRRLMLQILHRAKRLPINVLHRDPRGSHAKGGAVADHPLPELRQGPSRRHAAVGARPQGVGDPEDQCPNSTTQVLDLHLCSPRGLPWGCSRPPGPDAGLQRHRPPISSGSTASRSPRIPSSTPRETTQNLRFRTGYGVGRRT